MAQPGTFSPAGWTVNSVLTPWIGKNSAGTAFSQSGFSFSFTPPSSTPSKVAIAWTGLTDTIQGGPSSGLVSNGVGIELGKNTVLDLGPARSATGNRLIGYGGNCGIRIGEQPPLFPLSTFRFDKTTGLVKGGLFAKDTIDGVSYNPGGAGIENYGIIELCGGADSVFGTNTSGLAIGPGTGTGIINWGRINTGGLSLNDNDVITGTGTLVGISNFVDLALAEQPPEILTGLGDDVITGTAKAGNAGIVNDGLIDMGRGNDKLQSTAIDGSGANRLGGIGVTIMGAGSDSVTGFGTGTFFGDGVTALLGAGKKDVDSLNLIAGREYVITAASISYRGRTFQGFDIANGGDTMRTFGFETFGTSAGNQQVLAAGTFSL